MYQVLRGLLMSSRVRLDGGNMMANLQYSLLMTNHTNKTLFKIYCSLIQRIPFSEMCFHNEFSISPQITLFSVLQSILTMKNCHICLSELTASIHILKRNRIFFLACVDILCNVLYLMLPFADTKFS